MNPDPQELKEIKVTNLFVLTLFITLETSSASGSKTVHCSANFNQFAGGKICIIKIFGYELTLARLFLSHAQKTIYRVHTVHNIPHNKCTSFGIQK